jgi:hypothetical protein
MLEIIDSKKFEIVFLNHVSLLVDNEAYCIYTPDLQLGRKDD